MKKLFGIKDVDARRIVPDVFFLDKAIAKKKRDALNKEAGSPRFAVTYGPDHKKYKHA